MADAQRDDGAWVAILVVGVLLFFAGTFYFLYRFMCKSVAQETELRSTTNPIKKAQKKARAKPGKLPKGWTSHEDVDGDVYYYHESTETTSWDHPSKKKHSRVKSTGVSLPPGWEQHTSEEGEFYYENKEGNVQWDKPDR